MTWVAIGELWMMVAIIYSPWLPAYIFRHRNRVAMYIHKEIYLDCVWRRGVLRVLRLLPGFLLVAATAAAMHMYFSSPSDNARHYNNFKDRF